MPHPNQNGSLGCKSSHWDAASRAQWHWDANPSLLVGCTTGMQSKNWRRNAIGISLGCATSFGGCYALGMPVGCAKNNPGCHWDALKKLGCSWDALGANSGKPDVTTLSMQADRVRECIQNALRMHFVDFTPPTGIILVILWQKDEHLEKRLA